MISISNEGIVRMSRGDSFSRPVFINAGTEIAPIRYKFNESDLLYFALMEPNQTFEKAILKKVIDHSSINEHGDPVLSLASSDTENLETGLYYYTLKLRRQVLGGDDLVDTVVPNTQFWIGE